MANNLEIDLPPNAWFLPGSNHPDRKVVQNRPFLSYDDTTVESAYSVPFIMPAGYTGSGTLKADVSYTMSTATSGKIDFEISVEAVTSGDAQDIDAGDSFDTANGANETVPATAGYMSILTVTLTNKDSVAAGDYVRLKLERDADDGTNDTASGDARVFHVRIYEEA